MKESRELKEYSEQELINKIEAKFKALKQYAENSGWFLLKEIKEDEENWTSLSYLTQSGKLIGLEMYDEGISINNEDGDFSFNFSEDK